MINNIIVISSNKKKLMMINNLINKIKPEKSLLQDIEKKLSCQGSIVVILRLYGSLYIVQLYQYFFLFKYLIKKVIFNL
jgi:hypothetical protein